MSTMASDRSWLLNPGTLKLFNQCRRLIQSEFGVKLRTTDEELEHRLAGYAGRTRSSQLAKVWEALEPQIPALEMPAGEDDEHSTPADRPNRMYRGQPVADNMMPGKDQRKKLIYRGQVVGR